MRGAEPWKRARRTPWTKNITQKAHSRVFLVSVLSMCLRSEENESLANKILTSCSHWSHIGFDVSGLFARLDTYRSLSEMVRCTGKGCLSCLQWQFQERVIADKVSEADSPYLLLTAISRRLLLRRQVLRHVKLRNCPVTNLVTFTAGKIRRITQVCNIKNWPLRGPQASAMQSECVWTLVRCRQGLLDLNDVRASK